MDIVVGDVSPVDIYVDLHNPDGTVNQATFREIAWMDVTTNRVYSSFYLAKKGTGVTRVQVGLSFANMVRAWGMPLNLYLDNGSEYKWDGMLDAFVAMSTICKQSEHHSYFDTQLVAATPSAQQALVAEVRGQIRDHGGVIRAGANNAKSKIVEGHFGNSDGLFSMTHTGYVGGDRQAKKTHNMGKKPLSFAGDADAFLEHMATLLKFYHNKPQRGHLSGFSPTLYQAIC